jgi:hypothetical protein
VLRSTQQNGEYNYRILWVRFPVTLHKELVELYNLYKLNYNFDSVTSREKAYYLITWDLQKIMSMGFPELQ